MDYLINYALFFAKTATFVIAILILIAGFVSLTAKGKTTEKGKVTLKKLNKKFQGMAKMIQEGTLSKAELKKARKACAAKAKQQAEEHRKRVFVIDFKGDIKASRLTALREQVTAILTTATHHDEVLVCVESGGGLVHAYGLCASQLNRLKQKNIPLTVAVDKVAASGGYMMACVADRIVAAPFAILGSIGVLAQLPNFHRFLKEHRIDFEQLSAGEFKRTLTLFGENNTKARKKMQAELEDTHVLFKDFVNEHRPQLDMNDVATGEHWFGQRAIDLKLVDELTTSDDYLLTASQTADLYRLNYATKKSLGERLAGTAQSCIEACFNGWWQKSQDRHYF